MAFLSGFAEAHAQATHQQDLSLTEMLAALRNVADGYPPRVANEQQRKGAETLWLRLEQGMKGYLANREKPDFNGELVLGDIYRMGHNLDIDGAADNAVKHLKNAIALQPDSYQAHYLLGYHLTFMHRLDEGLPELLLAYALAPEAERGGALFALAITTTSGKISGSLWCSPIVSPPFIRETNRLSRSERRRARLCNREIFRRRSY